MGLNKVLPWASARPAFLLLNIIGRLLAGGGSLLIQVSIKFDPGKKVKRSPYALQIEDRDNNMINFRPARGRRMISKGLIWNKYNPNDPDAPLFRHL